MNARFDLRIAGFLALLAPTVALAGAVIDSDIDLIPDQFDNCRLLANGPNQGSNQIDIDLDGFGNRCDTDYDQSGTTTVLDFSIFLGCFGIPIIPGGVPDCRVTDHDGSSTVTPSDFGTFLTRFSAPPGAPGPSGLVCANPLIRIDLGDVPCVP